MIGHIPYLNTEYARQKDQECYDIEARQKEKTLDDGEQEGNEYKKSIPGTARTPKADVLYDSGGGGTVYDPPPKERKEDMQQIILRIARWLIKYVDGYHVAKNGGGKRKNTEGSKGNE